jgi:hypothetical protein
LELIFVQACLLPSRGALELPLLNSDFAVVLAALRLLSSSRFVGRLLEVHYERGEARELMLHLCFGLLFEVKSLFGLGHWCCVEVPFHTRDLFLVNRGHISGIRILHKPICNTLRSSGWSDGGGKLALGAHLLIFLNLEVLIRLCRSTVLAWNVKEITCVGLCVDLLWPLLPNRVVPLIARCTSSSLFLSILFVGNDLWLLHPHFLGGFLCCLLSLGVLLLLIKMIEVLRLYHPSADTLRSLHIID